MQRSALVTGAAGFIGSHVVDQLLDQGWRVTGIDSFDDFYDPMLKVGHIGSHVNNHAFRMHNVDIRDREALFEIGGRYDVMIHLAGLAGVRPSSQRPHDYYDVNVGGTLNLVDMMEELQIPRMVFASSSSIYGINEQVPWQEHVTPMPISVYANTKLAGESILRQATQQLGITALAFRFFTVYGPRQRPDLAITKFAAKMLRGEPIQIYGDGTALRDFTFIDDIVDGVLRGIPETDEAFAAYNLARGERVQLMEVVDELQNVLGVEADVQYTGPVHGDVPQTWGCIENTKADLGYRPSTSLRAGLEASTEWFRTVAATHGRQSVTAAAAS